MYNAVCVALAGYVVVGVVRYKLEKPGTFACNAPDLSPAGQRLAQVMWCACSAPNSVDDMEGTAAAAHYAACACAKAFVV